MKKYLVLYMMPTEAMEAMMKNSTPEEQKAGMDEWKQWMSDHSSIFSDIGSPAGKTKKVTANGVADVRNEILGYAIVEAESLEHAAQLFENSPQTNMEGGSVEVMELMPMEGM